MQKTNGFGGRIRKALLWLFCAAVALCGPLPQSFAEIDQPQETPAPAETEYVPADPMGDLPIENMSGPLSGLIIGIDAGHQAKGNYDHEPIAPDSDETKAKVSSGTQGCVSGVPEYITNLEVSLLLRDALETLGAQVHMTRTEHDVDISNIERALMFNEVNADLVLRIHCNGASNPEAKGIGLFVTETGAIAEESYAISECLLETMLDETGAERYGIFTSDGYTGLNWSEVPSIIVEMGFMSNAQEDLLLQDPEYQSKLVEGMVRGIALYFERDLAE
ncbi:MAG: N-acetylmuramoyl-L-alanine amidase [Eubacteriales bacterium]|nr:N-acetylmuramoyl-L-alanine amidase [Eubacteriales bacterium]